MPKDVSSDIRIEPVAGKPVELPNGNFIANAEMTRVGTDLNLSSPDGQTIVVEGYFTQDPAPDLVTADGARMSPQLVDSFLPPEHIGQYASSGQITNDASAAGKITEVIGEAHIVRSDGTQILATIGTSVFQGDVIETSKTGAVNILFADNTTFAVSESARLAVDQFVYNSAEQSGSSFFSMLQGMFVYTSGMIGKSDPGNVSIETPVGSIGIRGTVVAGEILPAGQESKITILDGAITFTNDSGTQELNTSFATVSLNSYQSEPVSIQMDAQTFSTTYSSLSSVAGDTLNHFDGTIESATPAESSTEDITAPAETPTETEPTADTAEPTAPATEATAEPEATIAPDATMEPTVEIAPVTTDTAILSPLSTVSDFSTTLISSFDNPVSETISVFTADTTIVPPPPIVPTTTTSTDSTALTSEQIAAPIVELVLDTGISGTDRITQDGTLKVSGLITGALVQYSANGGATWSNTSPATFTQGSNTVLVQQTDVAGNVSAATSFTFVYDTTSPVLPNTGFNDNNSNDVVTVGRTLVYTVTFSEDIANATVTAADFDNAGTADITIDTITETSPGVFSVEVTTTSTGSLILETVSGAVITDVAGNALNTAAAITDDTTITVDDPSFHFSNEYINYTPADITDDGLGEFAETGTFVGTVLASGADHYSIAVNGAGVPQHFTWDDTSYVIQDIADYTSVFSIDNSTGEVFVNDSLAFSHFLNPGGLTLDITIYDSSNSVIGVIHPIMLIHDSNDITADIQPQISDSDITGTSSDDFLVSVSDITTAIAGKGGADVLIGLGTGDNLISVSDNTFIRVDGGDGSDTLTLGNLSSTNFSLDFTTFPEWKVNNIENINLGLSDSPSGGFYMGNHIKLDIQSVFDMTDPITNTLNITAAGGSIGGIVDIIMNSANGNFTLDPSDFLGVEGTGTALLTYTGTHIGSGETVTLVIHQNNTSSDASGDITVSQIV